MFIVDTSSFFDSENTTLIDVIAIIVKPPKNHCFYLMHDVSEIKLGPIYMIYMEYGVLERDNAVTR